MIYVCPVCHNYDEKYLGNKNGIVYCRKCILLSRLNKANNILYERTTPIKANLNYKLTSVQNKASLEILNYVKNNQSVIVNAICGAGKTELVYNSIEYFINQNKKVGFAIPRKDVVIEIYNRLRNDYSTLDICAVYGNHSQQLNGQLVVLTTHQLFRYKNYFDLLILDEADAFPYYNNEFLEMFLNESVNGPIIYLSATIKESYQKICKNVVYVNRRFHNVDLPIPKIVRYNIFNKINVLKKTIKKLNNKPLLIFVPTIKIGKYLQRKLSYHFVYSSLKEKQKYIDDFKNNKIKVLITTSILERGITFFDVQVIVFQANHTLFDMSSLIQISGRVGRKIKAPTGKIFFLSSLISKEMIKCIKTLKAKNKMPA